MNIIIAKTAGFCMGVRRAVDLVLEAANQHSPIFTYGPLIHNPQVLNLLKEKGISIINEIPVKGQGTVLIRAHGVPPSAKAKLKQAGFNVIDATCPRVIKVQTIIRRYARREFTSIIIGDENHPEVIGLLGYSADNGYVVNSADAFIRLPRFKNAIIVAQTTQDVDFYNEIKSLSNQHFPHYIFFNTICDSTEKRQTEITKIAQNTDAVIVVGGRESGNTQRLVQISSRSGKPTFHIEHATELDMTTALADIKSVAITAGASTPSWIIQHAYKVLEAYNFRNRNPWAKRFFPILRTLLRSNLYLALGAGGLCFACTKLQGIEQHFKHSIVAFLYILSMHIFNHLTAIKADQYNDPERAEFYKNNKWFLAILAIFAGGAGLLTAYSLGLLSFITLLAMSLCGLSYNIHFPIFAPNTSSRRFCIKHIPGSKTILITMAWGIVTSVLPALSIAGTISRETCFALLVSSVMVFARTAFFDIIDMQGDRIVGKETLPLLIGAASTEKLLTVILIALCLLLYFASKFQWISSLGLLLTPFPLLMLIIIKEHTHGRLLPGFKLEFLTESLFILVGILTFFWSFHTLF